MTIVYRTVGDVVHLAAIVGLLLYICKKRSCSGISGKTQLMYALVFTTRYLDVFTTFISVYNMTMKILFLTATYLICILIYVVYRSTYDQICDRLYLSCIIIPIIPITLYLSYSCEILELLWTFSIIAEAVAILPQLYMITHTGPNIIVPVYIFSLALYRGMYILNWIDRYDQAIFFQQLSVQFGLLQFILYFLYFYCVRKSRLAGYMKQNLQISTISGTAVTNEEIKKINLLEV